MTGLETERIFREFGGGAELLSDEVGVETTPLQEVSVAHSINKNIDLIRLLNHATGNSERFEVVIPSKDNDKFLETFGENCENYTIMFERPREGVAVITLQTKDGGYKKYTFDRYAHAVIGIEASNQKTSDTLECDGLAYSQLHFLTSVLMESVVN